MCENATGSRSWTAGCGESYLSGAGSAGGNSTAERQHGRRPSTPLYSLYGKTLGMVMAALWVVFTPTQPVPPTTTAHYPTLPHPPAAHVVLWSQSEEPASVELRVPEALVNALLTEGRSSETLDLRVPEALLEHLYGAGRASGLEKSPAPWDGPF